MSREITTIYEGGARYYLVGDTKCVSVTTPLGLSSVQPLELWKMRVGTTKASIIGKRAANRGNTLHDYFDKICQGKIFEVKENYKDDVNAFREWFDENVEGVIATEKVVWSDTYMLAGRYDFLGRIKGYDGICILDWKTGRIKPEHFLQLSAYRMLTAETDGIPIESITNRLVVSIKDGRAKTVPSDKKNPFEDLTIDSDWEVYKCFLEIWRWKNKGKKRRKKK